MSGTNSEIFNRILDELSGDWGIKDDVISRLLFDMHPGRIVSLEALTSGKIEPTTADVVDLLNVREKLRRTYTLRAGTVPPPDR